MTSSSLDTGNGARDDRSSWASPVTNEPLDTRASVVDDDSPQAGDQAARTAEDTAAAEERRTEQERRRVEKERQQQVDELQHRWLITQAQILDDPRDAVREAGLLIGDALQFLTTTLAAHRDRIEGSWKNESELSTDELRDIMRRYRTLFQYVLSVTQIPEK